MAKHITRWTPDTHPDVTLEYEWDDADPLETRQHTFKQFVKAPVHARFTGSGTEKYQKILEENQRKNTALKEVLAALPDSEKDTEIDHQGNEIKKFKSEPKWSLDENGNVEIELTGQIVKNKVATKAIGQAIAASLGQKVRVKE